MESNTNRAVANICVALSLLTYSTYCNSSPIPSISIDLTRSGGDGFLHTGDIVVDATLESIVDIDGGIQIGGDTPSITYDSDKGVLVGNLGGILWQDRPYQEKLLLRGHISFILEGRFFDTNPLIGIDYGINQHLFTAIASNDEIFQLRHSVGQQLVFVLNPMLDMQLIRTGGGTNGAWGGIRTQRVDISWSGEQLYIFIDYYMVWKGYRSMQMDFSEIYAGSRGMSWENSLSETWIRDFKVSTEPVMLIENPDIGRISMFGDSFVSNGQYPRVGGNSNFYFAIEGVTRDSAIGICYGAGDQFGDYGLMPSIHRKLNSLGIYPTDNKISNWSEKSSGVTTGSCNLLSSRVDVSVVVEYESPDVALFVIGTNDVANGESNWESWKNSYLYELDKLIAKNPDMIIIIANVAPMTPDIRFDTPYYRAAVDLINLKILEMVNERKQITVIDMFNALGGHDDWSSDDFNIYNDRHPSALGYQKYADLFVLEILARYESISIEDPVILDNPIVLSGPTTAGGMISPWLYLVIVSCVAIFRKANMKQTGSE